MLAHLKKKKNLCNMNSSANLLDPFELQETPCGKTFCRMYIVHMILFQVPSPVSKRIMVHVHCECLRTPFFDQVANDTLNHPNRAAELQNICVGILEGWDRTCQKTH